MSELYRMLSLVEVKVEKPNEPEVNVSMNDEKAVDYVRDLLKSREFMKITITAKDGE